MAFQPMPLSRKPAPFDHPEWVFELKDDGFRALAVIQNGELNSSRAMVIRSTRSTHFGKQ